MDFYTAPSQNKNCKAWFPLWLNMRGISGKWDPRPGTFSETRDPKPGTHLMGVTWGLRPRTLYVKLETRDQGALLDVGPETRDSDPKSGTWDVRLRKFLAGGTRVQRSMSGPKNWIHSKHIQQQNQIPNIWNFQKFLYLMPEPKVWVLSFKKKLPKWQPSYPSASFRYRRKAKTTILKNCSGDEVAQIKGQNLRVVVVVDILI